MKIRIGLFAILALAVSAAGAGFYKGGSAGDSALPGDQWLNETGDTAEGDFNWNGYDITGIDDISVTGTVTLPASSIIRTFIADNAINSAKIENNTITAADIYVLNLEDLDDVEDYEDGGRSDGDAVIWDGDLGLFVYGLPEYSMSDLADSFGSGFSNAILVYRSDYWQPTAFSYFDLGDLGDVTVTSPAENHFVRYYSGGWQNDLLYLDFLEGVNPSRTPDAGQVLTYYGGQWTNRDLPDLAQELDDLTDVDTAGVNEYDFLWYQSGTWLPRRIYLDDIYDVDTPRGVTTTSNVLMYVGGYWQDVALPADVDTMDNLSDTDLSGINEYDILWYQSGTWFPTELSLVKLADVDPVGVTNGQILVYNSGTSAFEPGNLPIDTDTTITNLTQILSGTNGQWITHDGSTWVATSAPAADLSGVWLANSDGDLDGWVVANGYGLSYSNATSARYTFSSGLAYIQGSVAGKYLLEGADRWNMDGGLHLYDGLYLESYSPGTVPSNQGLIYVGDSGQDLSFKTATETVELLVDDGLIQAVGSLDGVYNYGGNIDLVAGAGITITPSDAANTITIAGSTNTTLWGLIDVSDTVTNATNGQLLKWDSTGEEWVLGTDDSSLTTGSVARLEDIGDVTIATYADRDFLALEISGGTTNWIDTVISTGDLPAHAELHEEGGADEIDLSTWEWEDLGNVSVSASPGTNEIPYWTGASWANTTLSLDFVSDVTITSPATNAVLQYNGAEWIDGTLPSHTHTLDGLTDTDLSGIAEYDVLWYQSGTWLPTALTLRGLTDTSLRGTNTQYSVLYYDTATSKWTDNVLVLTNLGDVTITSPATNSVLTFDGAEWIDQALPDDADAMSELTDVDLTGINEYDVLWYQSGTWLPTALTLRGLTDTNLRGTNDQHSVLYYDTVSSKWVDNVLELSNLSDVDTSGAGTNAFLYYTGAAWAPTNTLDAFITDIWVDAAGDTMSGDLHMAGNEIYLDSITSQWVGVSGGHLTLDAGSSNLVFQDSAEFNVDSDLIYLDGATSIELDSSGHIDLDTLVEVRANAPLNITNAQGGVEATLLDAASKGIFLDAKAGGTAFEIGQVGYSSPSLDLTDWTDLDLADASVSRSEIGVFNLEDISNLDTSGVAHGYVITYDTNTTAWVVGAQSGGGGSVPSGTDSKDILYWSGSAWLADQMEDQFGFDDLANTSLDDVSANDIIKWTGTAWDNVPISSAALPSGGTTERFLIWDPTGTPADWVVTNVWSGSGLYMSGSDTEFVAGPSTWIGFSDEESWIGGEDGTDFRLYADYVTEETNVFLRVDASLVDHNSEELAYGVVDMGTTFDQGGYSRVIVPPVFRAITLYPEFAGAVFTPDGSDNTVSVTSTNIADGNTLYNCYAVTTAESDINDYDLIVQVKVPENFLDWSPGGAGEPQPLQFWMRGTTNDTGYVQTVVDTAIDGSAWHGTTAFSNTVDAANTWEPMEAGISAVPELSAGDTLNLRFRMYARDGQTNFLGKVVLNWLIGDTEVE